MSLKYHLVSRINLQKGAPEGSRLFYGQVKTVERITIRELSESVSALSTSSEGDVEIVLEGLLMVMRQYLAKGNIIELGDLGSFRIIAGSKGVEKEEDFNTSHFKRGHIRYTPGVILRDLFYKVKFEKLDIRKKEIPCEQEHAM